MPPRTVVFGLEAMSDTFWKLFAKGCENSEGFGYGHCGKQVTLREDKRMGNGHFVDAM